MINVSRRTHYSELFSLWWKLMFRHDTEHVSSAKVAATISYFLDRKNKRTLLTFWRLMSSLVLKVPASEIYSVVHKAFVPGGIRQVVANALHKALHVLILTAQMNNVISCLSSGHGCHHTTEQGRRTDFFLGQEYSMVTTSSRKRM